MTLLLGAMCALACILAYLLCGFPSAYVVGKRLAHIDVRTVGSGNVGSTNITRAAGAKAGVITLVLDVLKAVVSVLLGWVLVGWVGAHGDLALVAPGGACDWTMALVYAFCVLGHVFTPYLHFKGGKGIAVGFGGAVALMPAVGFALWVPFLLLAVTTRYVSLGSITAAVCLPFLAAFIAHPTPAFLAVVCVVAALVVWAHRANIVKLARGQERKFSVGGKGKPPVEPADGSCAPGPDAGKDA